MCAHGCSRVCVCVCVCVCVYSRVYPCVSMPGCSFLCVRHDMYSWASM